MDGINSMTGNPPQLAPFLALAREHDALLYVDDAHGFGVVGERDRSETSPYGRRGNGVVRHLGEGYDHVVLTGGFSKAYSSLLAFVACPPELKRLLKVTAPPYLYSGPSPVASLASVLLGLQVNQARGDELRALLWQRTRRILDHLDKLGAFTLNRSGFPIVEVPLADPDDLARAGRFLLDRGIYVTLAFYPGVPRQEVGFRIQVTAANTDDQVGELLAALDRLADVAPCEWPAPDRRPQPGRAASRSWPAWTAMASWSIASGLSALWSAIPSARESSSAAMASGSTQAGSSPWSRWSWIWSRSSARSSPSSWSTPRRRASSRGARTRASK
jgi:hypothetical protein